MATIFVQDTTQIGTGGTIRCDQHEARYCKTRAVANSIRAWLAATEDEILEEARAWQAQDENDARLLL